MGREVVESVTNSKIDISPKIAREEPKEMIYEIKECTEEASLQLKNKKHSDDEDDSSITSSGATSLKTTKSRVTHGTAPRFRSAQRAEKRKEYYQKLEEKHQALEAERKGAEQRQKEEQEAAIKELRKNLKFKANPVPNFYYEGHPPKPKLKKFPLTRPKSPRLNISRRKSGSDANGFSGEENPKKTTARNRRSVGTFQNNDNHLAHLNA